LLVRIARSVRCNHRGALRSKTVEDPAKLRELAAWYREFAEQSGNPAIWDGRLRTAEDLEAEANQLETVPHSWPYNRS